MEEKSKPYLSWIVRSTPPAEDAVTAMGEPSCDPHLLHFGRLLMEIGSFERIQAPARGLELQNALLKIIEDGRVYLPQDSMFVEAVKACLSTEGKMAAVGEGGSNEIRDFIYRKIVVNLECSVAGRNAPHGLSKSSTLRGQPPISSVSRALMSHSDGQRSKYPSSPELVYSFTDESEHASHVALTRCRLSKAAKTFRRNMKIWLDENILPLSDLNPPATNLYSQQKIKVAIIDSGASKTDFRIRAALRAGRIRGGRNFLPQAAPDDWDDVHGHGTIITSLLLDDAPNAEIYIAKITDKVKIDPEGLFCVGRVWLASLDQLIA